jgi:hypothetical protein
VRKKGCKSSAPSYSRNFGRIQSTFGSNLYPYMRFGRVFSRRGNSLKTVVNTLGLRVAGLAGRKTVQGVDEAQPFTDAALVQGLLHLRRDVYQPVTITTTNSLLLLSNYSAGQEPRCQAANPLSNSVHMTCPRYV